MPESMGRQTVTIRGRRLKNPPRFGYVVLCVLSLVLTACSELQRPKVEPFYAETTPPPKQELRWSNGKMPKSLDPARAAAAPETDIVRAVYEGLTDLDSTNLGEAPGVAEKWESSDDLRTWTFHLRKDAVWSNGERVTARDFVRSWQRLADMGDTAANSHLFQNIVGMRFGTPSQPPLDQPSDFLNGPSLETEPPADSQQPGSDSFEPTQPVPLLPGDLDRVSPAETLRAESRDETALGVVAVDDLTLKVSLLLPDKDFPKLVSNPIFRPVYGAAEKLDAAKLDQAAVTNGAFKISRIGAEGISLVRSENYWNRKSVTLENVRFVAANTAEAALNAYKRGEVDVVTNAAFAPLGQKLLAPYEDFRRTAHGALNFYEFNATKPPFDDRRVREAMAIAIDRAKLTDGDLEGTTQPADRFLPLGEATGTSLSFDAAKAKRLLENAGYAEGAGFPVVRLVINRNDTQHRVARSVSRMWKQNLNIETEIVVKETSEIEDVRKSGDFDLVRRGVVLAANDEMVNLYSIFGSVEKPRKKSAVNDDDAAAATTAENPPTVSQDEETGGEQPLASGETVADQPIIPTLTEEDAIFELTAIPLYFPASYSLVKPFVLGFETNGLDAPSLKEVSIDNNWRPAKS